jgi:L-asparaginase
VTGARPRPGSVLHIHVIATGGTIATGASGLAEHGVAALLAHVDAPAGLEVTGEDVGPRASASWDVPFLHALRARVLAAMGSADAVVVTQGTDTLEETAYLFDRWQEWPKPLVFTGAMRNPSLPSPDGPGNLALALLAATSPDLAEAGVLVALADEVHQATWVEKGWSQRVFAFTSPAAGPLAQHAEGSLRVLWRPLPHRHFPSADLGQRVALLRTFLGMGPEDVPEGPLAGLVVEGMGAGHVPERILPALDRLLAAGTVVVSVPRPAVGTAARKTYAFPGSERDLLARGVLMGTGPGVKARIRLWLALSSRPRPQPEELADVMAEP